MHPGYRYKPRKPNQIRKRRRAPAIAGAVTELEDIDESILDEVEATADAGNTTLPDDILSIPN